MLNEYQQILNSFDSQINKILKISEFDRDILGQVIESLSELDERLASKGIDGSHFRPGFAISLLNSLYNHGHERARYKPIFNQSIVLLVSYFGSAIGDIFRASVSSLLQNPDNLKKNIARIELKFTLKELSILKFNLEEDVGELIIRKTDISFQDMQSIQRVFNDYFGIKMDWDDAVSNIILSQACRHVIVHNSEVVDAKCMNQIRDTSNRVVQKEIKQGDTLSFTIEDIELISKSMLSYVGKLIDELT